MLDSVCEAARVGITALAVMAVRFEHEHEDNANCWADNHEEIRLLPRRAGFGGVQRAPPG